MQQTPFQTEAQYHTVEILSELSQRLAGDNGLVDDNSELRIAEAHGIGYLTGVAAALLDDTGSDESMSDAEWEDDIVFICHQLILAVVERRRRASRIIGGDEGGGGNPSKPGPDDQPDGGQQFPGQFFFVQGF